MSKKILFAGGGTAGHVEPALAVASLLSSKQPEWNLIFVGTKSGLENQLVPNAGFQLVQIPKVLMPRKLTPAVLFLPFKLIYATIKSLRICKGADLIIGFGGYACPPIYLAAAILKRPIFIHEANAIPGWANRLGAPFSKMIFIAFARAARRPGKWRDAKVIGMPIRSDILTQQSSSESERLKIKTRQLEKWNLSLAKPTILVFGGSQGSRHINEAILQTLSFFTEKGVQIVHSVGKNNPLPPIAENYLPLSYIDDMASAYQACDLVIARSGALTCAELAIVGKFAILIPLAIGNGEQSANAEDLQQAGAAQLVADSKFNADWLISNWEDLWLKSRKFKSDLNQEILASEVIVKSIMDEVVKK